MFRALLGVALLAGCAEPDERPLTVEYAPEAIFAPACGNAQCHSSFRQAEGFALDTVEAVKREMLSLAPIGLGTAPGGQPIFTADPDQTQLIDVLTRAVDRMPYDQPLPENDIDYLRRFIEHGAPGAQCLPELETACIDEYLFECKPDANYGRFLEDCSLRDADVRWTCRLGQGCVEIGAVRGSARPVFDPGEHE